MKISTELKKRIITGFFGATALVLLIIYGGWVGITLLAAGLSLAMTYEYGEISFALSDRVEKRYVLLVLAWLVALLNRIAPQIEFQLLIFVFLSLFTYFLWTAERHRNLGLDIHFKELTSALFGVVYVIFLPLYLVKIYELTSGVQWVILFLLMVWAGDIGGYFAGKYFGKRKLYPLISPNKTREGALGGVLCALTVCLVYKLLFFPSLSWIGGMVLPLIVSIIAQTGDLCESFFKRAFGRKDSGSLLPGHGGVLDRFDAAVFSLPVMYTCIRLFN